MILAILLSSCLGSKYLESNQYLLLKDPQINGIPGEYKDDVDNLILQKANDNFLGFIRLRPQVYLHQFGKKRYDSIRYLEKITKLENKYDRKIENAGSDKRKGKLVSKKTEKIDKIRTRLEDGNWLMRNFEEVAIYDSALHAESVRKISLFLETKGYFRNTGDFVDSRKSEDKVEVEYNFLTGPRYFIDSINRVIPDQKIAELLRSKKDKWSPIEENVPYDQKILEDQREYIYTVLSNNGYYAFSRQYISFRLDTSTLSNQRIVLSQIIKNPPEGEHKIFKVDSVIFTSESSVRSKIDYDVKDYKGVTYRFGAREYKENILDWRLFIRKDSIYSRRNTLETQKQLSYLDAFKFVNINYDSAGTDLIANIFTSPLNKFQTSNEFGFISASQQLPGPFVNLSLKNRNTFKGLELVELGGNFSLQGIPRVLEDSVDTKQYSLFQYGAKFSIFFPQFLFPISEKFKRRIGSYNPKTRLTFSYNYEDRTGEYERSRINGNLAYIWRVEDSNSYTFTPISIGYNSTNIRDSFQEFLDEQEALGNGALPAAFRSSFISSSSIEASFNRNNYGTNYVSSSFLRVFAETGGNLVNLFGEDFFSGENLAYFRWAKLQIDYREVVPVNRKTSFAYRVNFGFAYPYGPSPSLPYEKRFYIGGSNSLRAWPIRRLGPGAFGEFRNLENDQNANIDVVNYDQEQGGDMILEMSAEIRKPLIGFIDYAFFLDAGNIWIINSDFDLSDRPEGQGDDGKFRLNSFYREIAVGIGAGLRLDFSFLIFRLDAAVQVYDPAQEIGNRFVLDDIDILAPLKNLGQESFQRQLLSSKGRINIAIGFPF